MTVRLTYPDKFHTRRWPCLYCGKNLELDRYDKKTIRINGKKHKVNLTSFCCVFCMKAYNTFTRQLRSKMKSDVAGMKNMVNHILTLMIEREPVVYLRRQLGVYSHSQKKIQVVNKVKN